MTKNEGLGRVLTSLADVFTKVFVQKGFRLEGEIAETLSQMKEGDLSSLSRLPGVLKDSTLNSMYGDSFFARDHRVVAKDLCGSVLLYAPDSTPPSFPMPTGIITATAGYSMSAKDRETAQASPGTIGVYQAQGKGILIISAHEPSKTGTVAIWGMQTQNGRMGMAEIGTRLEIARYERKVIGVDAPYTILPRDSRTKGILGATVQRLPSSESKGADEAYALSL